MDKGELQDATANIRYAVVNILQGFKDVLKEVYGSNILEHLSDEEINDLHEVSYPHLSLQAWKRVAKDEFSEQSYNNSVEECQERIRKLRPILLKLACWGNRHRDNAGTINQMMAVIAYKYDEIEGDNPAEVMVQHAIMDLPQINVDSLLVAMFRLRVNF